MTYNYYFEISALFILIMMLFDYRNKNRYLKRETRMFKIVVITTIIECSLNLLSSVMIKNSSHISNMHNIMAATLFFLFQAAMLYCLVIFSFLYMNPHLQLRSTASYICTLVFLANAVLAITTPFTHFYFYFDENRQYVQGPGALMGYLFYIINVLLCLAYVLHNRSHLLMKDMRVAGCVALFVGIGFAIQFGTKNVLILDLSIALSLLYMYMTLENPNDSIDKLTLCGNGYVFRHLIDEKCDGKQIFSVIFLDIRKFRFINATHGMGYGDLLLQQIAVFLENTFTTELIFRIHDDIFALIIDEPQSNLTAYITTLQQRFDDAWILPDKTRLSLELLITVCEYPRCFHNHAELAKLRNSMIQKQKGPLNQELLLSDESMYRECIRREQVEHILRKALEEHTLETYFQPIVDSSTQTTTSLEALSRLNDADLGFIPPDEFIAIAEANGLIIPLGFYVLENVCRFIHDHLLNDPHNTIRCVHINLSTLQCEYPSLTSEIREIIERYQVPVHMIQLELTESAMLHSPKRVLRTMEELRSYGILFALDDYGTGYSNISYLIQFPFHEVKFDKTIVQSCFENENAYLIMKNEFQILSQLGKGIILEGIETREQYEEMKQHGITLFQGYYFSRPQPEAQCVGFLKEMQQAPEKFFPE